MNAYLVAQHLQQSGPMEARYIARSFGIPLEEIYEPLVAAESLGLIRVNIEHDMRGITRRVWEAMVDA